MVMKRYKQFDKLIISDFEVDKWEHPLHNHNHYEIVFIAHGKGIHHLNKNRLVYKKGDLFMLGPEDEHFFDIQERTRFIYFKFTKLYLKKCAEVPVPQNWLLKVEGLLQNPERQNGNLLQDQDDRNQVEKVMQLMVHEYYSKNELKHKIIFQLFSILMMIIHRNNKLVQRVDDKEHKGIASEFVEYIELNIYSPDKLSLKQMALHFNYSENYLGVLFKKEIGSTIREYVSEYRWKLIKSRLAQSHLGMKQIAFEFGFVDESHLHKFIKRKTGKSLSFHRSVLTANNAID